MIFILLSVILVLLLINWIQLMFNKYRINIPGPWPLPILGNAHLFVKDTSDYMNLLNKLSLTYGNAFLVHLFTTPYVVISDPRYIEPILSSTVLITKGKSYRFLYQWLGQGLLTSTGQMWKTHRKFLTPAFHYNVLQIYLPVFCKHFKEFVKELQNRPKGSDIELFPVVALAALDVVTESLMGISVNAQKNRKSSYVKAIEEVSGILASRMQSPYLGEDAIFNMLPMKTKYDKAIRVLHNQTNKVIEARRRELNKANITRLGQNSEIGIKNKHAFLDLLLLAEVDGKKIDVKRVSDQLNTFMFEGHDTTTAAVSWTLFAVSKQRDVQEKIYAELKTIFGDDVDRNPTYYELNQMKYLELVIKESMRLYPPVPFIERFIEKDCEVGELKLIKNTTVLINIFQMHRHPEIYEDPLEFKPERFESPLNNAFDWLPFSAGPRNCIGQKFAMMAVKVAISEMIKNFIMVSSDTEPKFCAELILRSKTGVHIKLYPRS